MLKKDFHHAIIGNNFLSLMLAIEWLHQGRDVLILDDDRMQLGDLFSNDLGLLELLFLKSWGEERHIECLSSIERYLEPRHYYLIGDDVRVKLGLRPSENWREFTRKIFHSELVLDDEFDQNWIQYISRISQAFFRYGSYQQLTPDKLLVYATPTIKDVYNDFSQFIKSPRNFKTESIIRSALGYYSNRVDGIIDEADIFFLFTSIMSPRFSLNQKLLVDELLNAFLGLKGHYKETRMREWLFHKRKPWSVELSSYEGIIHPKHLTFVGARPTGMPFGLDPIDEHFATLSISADFPSNHSFSSEGFYVVSSQEKLGTHLPFWFLEVKSDKLLTRLLFPSQDGMKITFIEAKVLDQLKSMLPKILPNLPFEELSNIKLNFSSEVFVCAKQRVKPLSGHGLVKLSIFDSSNPGVHEKLKNVDYIGPYRLPKMGLFSSLVDLSIESQFT